MIHPLAGVPAPQELLVDPIELIGAHKREPDPRIAEQRGAFGTSGHRGCPLRRSFNEAHIAAITQAICDFRRHQGIHGPVFLGKDTHALSAPAESTVLEVLAGNSVPVYLQAGDGFAPTPAVSHAVITHNQASPSALADGVIVTPSHNPPEDGGLKYNPPHGGPADTDPTKWIESRANQLLGTANASVLRLPYPAALVAPGTDRIDFVSAYVKDIGSIIDMAAIRAARLKIGVAPLGGASAGCWPLIARHYGLNLHVVNDRIDPRFDFMPVDHDGKIRMDCSSPHAMAGLVAMRSGFDIAWGNDPDADRHGIVTPSHGLMNPNHFLAAAIHYLLTHRPDWNDKSAVGKTIVSSSVIDRVVRGLGRELVEAPVGFKWFSSGLADASLCFGGEESAGASFLRRDGTAWTTDKDGIVLGLLAAEMTAVTGMDPAQYYEALVKGCGRPFYTRVDTPVGPAQKESFARFAQHGVTAKWLAGDRVVRRAPVRHRTFVQAVC